ncbi:hypothetical protein FPV67DRAFT_1756514 [Lyophyllum atratum]|nr:hypothetical protein FPV67DRAFT_1756514 [Lyophyllum atratum]
MYTCQRQLLPPHLLDSCAYREVACPQGKCWETMLFKDSISHVHEEDENHDEVHSTKVQEAKPEASDIEALVPPVIDPPAATNEPRQSETSSVSTDIAPTSSTSVTAIARSVAPEPRLAVLTEQNILLRHRVDLLEGLLHGFKRDMNAVKRALGPWFRVGEGVEANANRDRSYFSTELPVGAQPTSASTSNAAEGSTAPEGLPPYPYPRPHQHPHAYQYPFPYTTVAPMPHADSLAPYFPAEVDDATPFHSARRAPPPASANPVRPHRSPSSVEFVTPPTQGYDPHTPYPAPHPSLVAPLNLGTTLEGTLHGLRDSVLGLAASVDSMGRRHEIALTNETSRMAEEVGGLRAGVHGLRMQIHAIMMDRNAQLTGRDGVGDSMNGQWMPLPAPQLPTRQFHAQQPSITKL